VTEPGSAQATSFGAAAAEYERGRPSYPDAAVAWLTPPGAARVLDLGAGTGKLTRQLTCPDREVVAVEPLGPMREQFHRVLPAVPVVGGRAEAIPVADQSVDAVLVAQAWHWVDPARAAPEIARVLRPGGRLGLVWNVRDERVDWVARLGQIMHPDGPPQMNTTNPVVGPPFGPLERRDVEWSFDIDHQGLIDLVASRSYVITRPAAERRALLDEVRTLLRTHPDVADTRLVAVPYVTRCFRAGLDG
jgi:SAM-dependent methyltransferase